MYAIPPHGAGVGVNFQRNVIYYELNEIFRYAHKGMYGIPTFLGGMGDQLKIFC